jgi:hypothetical protein
MKFFHLCFFISFYSLVYSQSDTTKINTDYSESINIDTITYGVPWNDTTDGSKSGKYWHEKLGFNQILDTSGSILMEGLTRRRLRLDFLFHFGKIRYTNRVGMWTYYCQNKVIGHKTYDKKGREIALVSYYTNGQVKEIKYREKGNKKWKYSQTYFPDGKIMETLKDLEEYIELINSEEKNCAQHGI